VAGLGKRGEVVTAEERAFVKALEEDRGDVTTRLVYADWLEERERGLEASAHRLLAEGTVVVLYDPRPEQKTAQWDLCLPTNRPWPGAESPIKMAGRPESNDISPAVREYIKQYRRLARSGHLRLSFDSWEECFAGLCQLLGGGKPKKPRKRRV
jgi:uncharacterized protein (TIGR02996 family)